MIPTPRSMTRRIAAIGISLSVIGVACSDDSKSADSTVPATAEPTTSSVPTTSTTEAPTTSTTELITTTTVAPDPVNPLTGTPLSTDPAVVNRPALVVKIDNAPGARPQTGFNEADLVFEEIVNDNLTRFAMVFQSQGSDPVGPCRSGRIQDINLFGSLSHPLFAWSGGNKTVTAAIDASDLVNMGPNRVGVYFRTKDKNVPHNLYTNTSALWAKAPPDTHAPQQQFQYRAADEAPGGVPAGNVDIKLDAIDVHWTWDAASGLYLRTMERSVHRDAATGAQVSTNNVLILVMNYLPGISDSPDAQTIGTGEAFLFAGGSVVHGTWSRSDRLLPFTLTADDGSPMKLTPGRTFIELPRQGGNVAPNP